MIKKSQICSSLCNRLRKRRAPSEKPPTHRTQRYNNSIINNLRYLQLTITMERPIIPRRAAVNNPIACSSPSSTYSMFIKTHRQLSTFMPGIIMRDMAVKHTETLFWLGRHRSNNYAFYKSKCLIIIHSKIIRVRQTCISLRVPDFLRDIPIVEEVARMI